MHTLVVYTVCRLCNVTVDSMLSQVKLLNARGMHCRSRHTLVRLQAGRVVVYAALPVPAIYKVSTKSGVWSAQAMVDYIAPVSWISRMVSGCQLMSDTDTWIHSDSELRLDFTSSQGCAAA